MRIFRPTWKTRDGEQHRSSRWWLDFSDPNGRRWRLPGLTDKRQTSALGDNVGRLISVRVSGDALPAELLRWLEAVPADFRQRLAEAGLIDRARAGGLVPLMDLDTESKVVGGHLADFLADADARGVSAVQRHMLGQRIRDTLRKAGAKWLRDLSAARIQAAIASFTEPTKARPDGLSKQSLQHYVRAIKQFSAWLHREGRTAEHMLIGVKGYNAETDKRHERRGFSAEEMAMLLDFTAKAPTRWGMSGKARSAGYALAVTSGLRRNEIRTLTRASFKLDGDPPTVTVEAGYSKHRRRDVQPLPADVGLLLVGYLAGADAEHPFSLPDKSGRMLHEDMADARTAWIAKVGLSDKERQARADDRDFLAPRDSGGLVLDFHSLRHGYVSAICRANVSPRVMMELARHSDPRLTMKRYSRVAVSDSAKALDGLPKVAGQPDEWQEARKTGTDDAQAVTDTPGGPRTSDRVPDRPMAIGQSDTNETDIQRFATSFATSGQFRLPPLDSVGPSGEIADSTKPLASCEKTAIIGGKLQSAPVAQLDRASVFGTEGYRFESCRVQFSS